MNRRIGDRFDLTLECIRRLYQRQTSPLSEVLDRYSCFFELFEDFRGYVDFFLLQDLVSGDGEAINFYLPFDEFQSSPLPQDLEAYKTYLSGVMSFSDCRARRMVNWCNEHFAGAMTVT
jgi:hypothetical protein